MTLATAQPFQVFQDVTGGGLELEISDLPQVKVNQSYVLNIHVFNGTSGYPVTSGASCGLHLYNSTLGEITESIVTTSNGFDYQVNISSSNFSKSDFYPYIVQCNTSTAGGFLSGYIEATETGFKNSDNPALTITLILLPLLFSALLLYGGLKMDEDHAALKYFLFLFIPPSLWASFHLATESIINFYPNWFTMTDNIAFYTQLSGWIAGVMFAYLFIYFIYTVFTSIAEKKRKRREGLDYGN